jgi:hypothetical protein
MGRGLDNKCCWGHGCMSFSDDPANRQRRTDHLDRVSGSTFSVQLSWTHAELVVPCHVLHGILSVGLRLGSRPLDRLPGVKMFLYRDQASDLLLST